MSGFEEKILAQLGGKLERLEQDRLQLLALKKKAMNRCLIMLMAFVLLMFVMILSRVPAAPAFSMGIIIYVILAMVMYKMMTGGKEAQFNLGFKNQLVAGIGKALQSNIAFHPEKGVSEGLFESCGHYTTGIDRYSSEDMFSGFIGDTEILFSEVDAEEKRTSRDSKGRTRTTYHTIFKGIFFMADFHKQLQTWVTVRPDNEGDGFFGWIGKTMEKFRRNIVKLENPEFEKHFRVQGGDDIQARYILTPDMQERLLELRKDFGGSMIVSFQRTSVYITVPKYDNWFEPDSKISVYSQHQVHKLALQMNAYFSIVETLNLNTRIWTKE